MWTCPSHVREQTCAANYLRAMWIRPSHADVCHGCKRAMWTRPSHVVETCVCRKQPWAMWIRPSHVDGCRKWLRAMWIHPSHASACTASAGNVNLVHYMPTPDVYHKRGHINPVCTASAGNVDSSIAHQYDVYHLVWAMWTRPLHIKSVCHLVWAMWIRPSHARGLCHKQLVGIVSA